MEAVIDSEGKPWNTVDGLDLCRCAAALQLIPANIPHLLLLQRAAAIGASLPRRVTARQLTPSKLRSLLKEEIISGRSVRQQEDSYDDIYVKEIAFHTGVFTCIEGLTSRSSYMAENVLRALFLSNTPEYPADFLGTAIRLVDFVLRLGDQVCNRSGLRRGIGPPVEQRTAIQVPGQSRLDELKGAVSFDRSDLIILGQGSVPHVINEWMSSAGNHELNLSDGTDSGLILRPLIRDDVTGDIVVANPGELVSRLRHFLIVLAKRAQVDHLLAAGLRSVAETQIELLLSRIGARTLGPSTTAESSRIVRQHFEMSGTGIYLDVAILTDQLKEFDQFDPFGSRPEKDLGQQIQDLLDPIDSTDGMHSTEQRVLRIAITETIGRSATFGFAERRQPQPLLNLSGDELRTIIEIDGGDPLCLWYFAEAVEKLHESARVLSWATLDLYSLYVSNHHSFYFTDGTPPTFVSVEPGMALDLRQKAFERRDYHHVLDPTGSRHVRVAAVYGRSIAPIYYTTADEESRYSLVVEMPDLTVWIRSPELEYGSLAHSISRELQRALAFWAWQILRLPSATSTDRGAVMLLSVKLSGESAVWRNAELGAYLDRSAGNSSAEPNHADTETFDYVDLPTWLGISCAAPDDFDLTVDVHIAAEYFGPTNTADRQIAKSLFVILTGKPGDDPDLNSELRKICPSGPKRMMRAITARNVPMRTVGIDPRLVHDAALGAAMDACGARIAAARPSIVNINAADRNLVLNEMVEYYFARLEEIIKSLSSDGLIDFLILQDEALLHAAAERSETLASELACFGEQSVLASELQQEHQKTMEASVANRFLIEYVVAQPPQGLNAISLVDYDSLLALASEIITRATFSDAIRYGFSDSTLSLLPSKRVGISRGDKYSAGTIAVARAHIEAQHVMAMGEANDAQKSTLLAAPRNRSLPDDALKDSIDSAMVEEFGFSLSDLFDGLIGMINLADSEDSEPARFDRSDVKAKIGRQLDWTPDKTEKFLRTLTLGPREKFLVGPEVYPWRFNRNLSYARRPFLIDPISTAEARLVWGVRRVWDASEYWSSLLSSARLQSTTDAMKKVMGSIRQASNKQFERAVKESLTQTGCPIVQSSVWVICGRRLRLDGHDLGDIDAIGIDPKLKYIVVAEAKDFELARTPAEIANEVSDLVLGERSATSKTVRRANWVQRHIDQVLTHFSVDVSRANWQVRPVIVTSRQLIGPLVIESKVPIIAIADFPNWLDGVRSSPHRRRRK